MPMKTVGLCETQPITAEGLRAMLGTSTDLQFLTATNSLPAALELVRHSKPDLVIADKSFGMQALLSWAEDVRSSHPSVALIVWGNSTTEAEALRLLQVGVRGIIRKSADIPALLSCLRAVAAGASWMEEALFRESPRREHYPRSDLTPREQQVLELVEQGLKNKEVARELGIRPGTVKIHLKHIFEKTGVRGRYGLALSGMKDRGLLVLPNAERRHSSWPF